MRIIGIIAVILAAVVSFSNATDSYDKTSINLTDFSRAFVDVAKEVMPSVVTITSAKVYEVPIRSWHPFYNDPLFRYFFDVNNLPQKKEYRIEGLGSGVIVSKDGYIVTCAHVVDGANEIEVHFQGKDHSARIIGIDNKSDIAVIKLDDSISYTIAKLGNSDNLRVGEWVLAIGSPFKLEHTVTSGIVSAKGRSRVGLTDYEDLIQTDASINVGNSGGALVNLSGEVIGINSAIYSHSGGNIGIGFAIPINLVKNVLDQIIKHGHVVRGWLGVAIQNITEEIAEVMELGELRGVLISDIIQDSPADKAGLKRGDIILAVNNKEVNNCDELKNCIANTSPGSKVNLDVFRDRENLNISAYVAEMPGESEYRKTKFSESDENLGLTVRELIYQDKIAKSFHKEGVYIQEVTTSSVAERAGILQNDILLEINGFPIKSTNDFFRVTGNIRKGDPILFVIFRNGNIYYLSTRIR